MDVQTSNTLTLIVLCVGCAAASIVDWRERKIPNAIPIAWAVSALALHVCEGLLAVGALALLGFALLVVGTALFSIGWLGGGDVKMLAAGAMLLGPSNAALFLISSMIAGGALAIVALAIKGRLAPVLRSVAVQLLLFRKNPRAPIQASSDIRLPYALAISAGAIFTSSVAYFPALIRIS